MGHITGKLYRAGLGRVSNGTLTVRGTNGFVLYGRGKDVTSVQKVKADLHIANGGYIIKGDGPMDYGMESIVFALGLDARIERDMISHRTRTDMAAKKALGYPDGKAGRPVGYRKLDGKREEINDLLKIGVTKLKVAERYGVSRVTLNRFLA